MQLVKHNEHSFSIGNHMDESVILGKIAWQQKNCTRQSLVPFNFVSNFPPKIALSSMGLLINRHDLPSLSPSGHYRTI